MIHPETLLRQIRTKTVLLCLIVLLVSSSIGDVPLLLNYQGKLTDGSGLPLEDPVSITFSLWDSPTGGNKIWEQTIALVDPNHGIFAVELDLSSGWETGYNINQFDIGVSYLQLEVDAVVLSPREKMTSSVNAINIADSMVTTPKIRDASVTPAKLADGGIVDQLLEWNSSEGNWELVATSGIAIDNDWIIDGSNQYSAVTGNVGIGTTSPAHKLDVQVDDGTDERVARIWNRSDDFGEDGLLVSTDRQASDAYILNAFSGGSGGSSKFFIRSDGNVGVGITTPTYRFQVAGSARMNSLNINGAYDFPTADGATGNALVTNGLGTVTWSEVGSDNDWTEVGSDIERQSGDVYIGDDNSTNNNLYISGVIYDWDNTTYFIDPGSASRFNEIEFDEGSVSDPPIWFEGEGNTGIFQPADDMIGVTINGSEALRVDDLGNVGIGTTTPSAKLEVANSDAIIHGHTVGRGASSVATNVALGNLALSSNTTGQYNIAIGSEALKANTTGISNIAIGRQALDANIGGAGSEGHANVAIGDQALTNNQSGGTNVAIGRFSLMSNISGSSNSAVGHQTLGSNVSGSNNTAIGYWALVNNTGNYNTAVGSRLLFLNTTGEENTGIGYAASTNNTTSSYNTAVGSRALYNNSAGNNTAVGRSSLYNSTTGSSNTALGYMSGYSLSPSLTSGNNTFLGANTGYSDGTISNATAVGANVTLAQSNTVILGNNANVGIGTNTPSYKLVVNGDIAVSGGLFDGENTGSANEVLTADGSGGMSWEPASGGGGSDNDWYEVGGTTPPDDITDNMYHTGNVAIGSADPGTYKLYVDGEAFVKTPTTGATSDGPAASTSFLLGEPSAQSASGNFKVYSYKGSGGVSYGGSGDNWGSQIIVSDAPLSGEGTSSSHLTIAVNSLTSAGVVIAGTGNPDKVWGTDGSGNPGWRNPSGGANELNELTDVEVSDYTAGDLLIADGTDSYDGIALSGDASITSAGILTVNAIQGDAISTTDPTDGQILKWNDTASEWQPADESGGGSDNLGDHTATENLQMSGHWVSNDGGDEGLLIDTDGNVTIKGNLLPETSGYNIGSTTERFDKIYASTIYADQIDPIVQIEGEQYVTWMSEGIGMLMETAGSATLANGIYAVDLAAQPRGSDLWLFYNVVAENSIIPIITPQDRAYLIAYMEGSILKVEALSGNENARFSYLLKGKRRDWAGKPIEEVNIPKEKISQPVNMDNYDKNGNLK